MRPALPGEEGFGDRPPQSGLKSFHWHGGSAYDAWFSCASKQVAQVLLTLPYSFSQLGMLSGVILQVFYGILGSWTAYLISVLYVEYRTRKEKEIFGRTMDDSLYDEFANYIGPEIESDQESDRDEDDEDLPDKMDDENADASDEENAGRTNGWIVE